MKLVDEKGKLFGKLNIVDRLVIIVIVAAAVLLAFKLLGGHGEFCGAGDQLGPHFLPLGAHLRGVRLCRGAVHDSAPAVGEGGGAGTGGAHGLFPAVRGGTLPQRRTGRGGDRKPVRTAGGMDGPQIPGLGQKPPVRSDTTSDAISRPAAAGTHMMLAGTERRPGIGASPQSRGFRAGSGEKTTL